MIAAAGRRTALLAAALLAGGLGALRADPAPAAFVERVESGLRAARALPDAAGREAGCAALLREAFDRTALAATVAAGHWAALPPAERAALAEAMGRRMDEDCRSLMARPDPGSPAVLRVRETEAGLRVTTQLPATDGTGSVVTWTLAPGGPWGWQARDVVADGRGLAATLRGEFEGALASRNGDVAAAIADLGARRAR